MSSQIPTAVLIVSLCLTLQAGELAEQHQRMKRAADGPAPAARPVDEIMSDEHGLTELGLERGPCFGKCPQYTVVIKKDGTFRFDGENNVRHRGRHTGRVDAHQFRQLAHFIRDSGFMNLRDNYEARVTDQAAVFTMVVINGQKKIVRNYANAGPTALWTIEQLIDKLLLEARWDP